MTITYRSVKGSNLTAAEVDDNFHDVDDRIAAIEDDPPVAVPPSNMTVSGTQWTIYYPDGLTFGPFNLPQANFRPSVTATISTTTHTPALGDANGYKRCTNAGGCAITIPDNDDVAFPVDTEITYRQCAAGPVTFDQPTDTAVTINGLEGFLQQTGLVGAVITIKKVATDEWDLFGLVLEDVTA